MDYTINLLFIMTINVAIKCKVGKLYKKFENRSFLMAVFKDCTKY